MKVQRVLIGGFRTIEKRRTKLLCQVPNEFWGLFKAFMLKRVKDSRLHRYEGIYNGVVSSGQ